MMLCLAPLRPDKVAARGELLARRIHHLLFKRGTDSIGATRQKFFPILRLLAIEFLLLLVTAIPPGPFRDNLSDGWVIIALADVKAEYLSRLLRLDAPVFVIEHLVQF